MPGPVCACLVPARPTRATSFAAATVAAPRPCRYRCRVAFRFNSRNSKQRDTAPPPQAEEAAPDTELESYLAALAPETGAETTDTGRRFGDAQVLQLRLNLIAMDELKQLAHARRTSPQALAQEWVLERLSWEANAAAQRRQAHPYQ